MSEDELFAQVRKLAAARPVQLGSPLPGRHDRDGDPAGRPLTADDVWEAKTLLQTHVRRLKDAEQRLADLEAMHLSEVARLEAELASAGGLLERSKGETRAALARCEEAEKRAHEAQDLLNSLVESISTEFQGLPPKA